jgi:hypothetical protein
MLTPHEKAAIRTVNVLRTLADDHLLTHPAGPIRDRLSTWTHTQGSRCAHIHADTAMPLFGLLCEPGARMCYRCLQSTAETIGLVEGPAPCDGCGTPLRPDQIEAAKIVLPIDAYLSVLGHACPTCRTPDHPTAA